MRARGVLVACLALAGPAPAADDGRLELITNTMREIRGRYVDEAKADPRKLIESAMNGVIDGLDAESLVMPEGKAGEAETGITVAVKGGVPWVADVADSSPAAAAGIRQGDRILRVNGENSVGKKRLEVERMLRGPANSSASILWGDKRGGYHEMVVSRAAASRPAWRKVPLGDAPLIQLFRIDDASIQAVILALKESAKSQAGGAVLDLRRASGGDVDAALALADACLPGGEVMALGRQAGSTRDRQYPSKRKNKPVDAALTVLTGPFTHGAAELLASALKEARRAVVVGRDTFGSAGRQEDFALPGRKDARVRLTVERFLTPAGVSLTGSGVGADMKVDEPEPTEAGRIMERHSVAEKVVERLASAPPPVFDLEALKRGDLDLSRTATKGRSAAEQRIEFESAFQIMLEEVLNGLDLDLAREEVDQERPGLISRVRVLLAARLKSPADALSTGMREDPEVVMALDVLRAVRIMRQQGGGG
jgi:carboxyl-terminal processing protease